SSSTVSRERGIGGSGSPILPQAALKKTRRQGDKETRRERRLNRPCLLVSLSPCLLVCALQDVTTEVFILNDVSEHLLNIGGVNYLVFLFQIRTFERNFVQHFLQNGVQTARAYIFRSLIHFKGEIRHFV